MGNEVVRGDVKFICDSETGEPIAAVGEDGQKRFPLGGSTTPAAGSVTAEMLAPSLAGQIAVTLPGTYSTDAARRAAVEADGRPDGTLYLVDDGA